jgi:hypothetical protein
MKKNLLLIAALALSVAGCKKDEETPTTSPTPTNSSFKIGYGFHWGAADFDLANTYTDGNGHAVKFTGVRFYFGEPHLMNAGVEVEHFHDTYFLANAATPEGEFNVGSIDPGSFDMLEIVIGLDSATNHADPTVAEAPLNDATMHWSWNPAAGYKFLLLEGRVDDDGDGVVDAADPEFTYHCATDAALREAMLAFTGSVAAGAVLEPHMEIHMDQLVTGVDMLASPMGMGYSPVNVQLMDNLSNALSIE